MSGNKRNLNELYNGNGNSNGSGMPGVGMNGSSMKAELNSLGNSIIDMTMANGIQECKKSRLDQTAKPQDPSRVIHLRGIPQQLADNEIIFIGLHFGDIKNVLFLRSKGQAFLEFENIEDAQRMTDYFEQNPNLTFHTKRLFVQYSNHQELNTDPSNSSNQIALAALQDATQLHRLAKQGGKNHVLRVTVLNMIYPVTLDVLNQIFSKFGFILKIITFTKNDKFQAFIQMKDATVAQNAKNSLHGQNIYNGCCTLQIDYSKLNSLEVKFNNDKSRDYTNLFLPFGEGQDAQNGTGSASGNGVMNGGGGMNQLGLISQPPGNMYNPMASNQFGGMGGMSNVGPGGAGGYNSMGNMGPVGGPGGPVSGSGVIGNKMNPNETTSVLLVTNLNEEFVTPEALFTLFGVYGDVLRVKVLFNKKDSALVNFVNPMHAASALANLDRIKLWNKQIRVFPSKHLTVQMPKDGQPDAGLTKDFTNSPLHRFKKPGSKNFNNIFPPSATLHLSNIPNTCGEQELKDLFSKYGLVKAFRFFAKDRKMALLQMGSVEEAIIALIGTHNHQLSENMHLRVAFSKAIIN